MRRRRATFLAFFGATVAALIACGSRTGLLVPEEQQPLVADDAGIDVGRDVFHPRDVSIDQIPPIDSQMIPDVQRNCADAASTLIYVVTQDNLLLSFDPPSGHFKQIGPIACVPPGPAAPTPFSMAVDREGIARVVFTDGEIFRVSTATAACQPTPWIPLGKCDAFLDFGMSYVTDDTGGGETLFVATDGNPARYQQNLCSAPFPPSQLGRADSNYVLHRVGPFNPDLYQAELTGTGDGRLFGFDSTLPNDTTSEARLVQIDKNTAEIIGVTSLPGVVMASSTSGGWAFGFWGGDFYFFTAPDGVSSIVQRYRPSDSSIAQVASLPNIIVGAGVSTCAPEL